MPDFNILDHGAAADGVTNDAPAIQTAVDACAKAGGGTVRIPSGKTVLCGAVRLCSRLRLHLEPGSVLLASPDPAAFHTGDPRNDSGSALPGETPEKSTRWLYAFEESDIAVTGTGAIDGNHDAYVSEKRKKNWVATNPRPQALVFIGCKGVRMRDVTVRHTPSWAIRLIGCEDAVLDGLTIDNSLQLVNSDGIDPDHSRHVRISNCHISTGDDGIVLKATKAWTRYGPCENITVTNCVVRSTCTAIKIGTETHSDIRNVTVSNCVIHDSSRGLAIDGRDHATCENILFSDIVIGTRLFDPIWWSRAEPIYICPLPRPESESMPGPLRHVRFRNILCRSENGVYVHGWDSHRPRDLLFENVRVEMRKTSRWPAGAYDPRPTPMELAPTGSTGFLDQTPWGSLAAHRNAGFFLECLEDVTLRGCEVVWGENPPEEYSHAIEAHRVRGLQIEGFRGGAAHPARDPARWID